ncbi:unnamed protein product [Cylicocyclus nassatus]|uniref:Uncharacterized protein n=1 Tax=Cylicocyclus nassatus TaxID=53992 RepID=A0AA36DQL4_CYLNA|nr:unnamed protein product [Cylicocyclus nassatus]
MFVDDFHLLAMPYGPVLKATNRALNDYIKNSMCGRNELLIVDRRSLRLYESPDSSEGEKWMHVKHEMRFMKGSVKGLESETCCFVEWDVGWRTHHFTQSALRLAN